MNRDEAVAGGVAAAAFACSAMHIYTVALDAGNPWPIAVIHPLGLDGLIYIGIRAISRSRRWRGWSATVYGAAMSLVFNAASYAHTPLPWLVMAFAMPVALLFAILVVHGAADQPAPRKRVAQKPTPAPEPKPAPTPDAPPAMPPPPGPAPEPEPGRALVAVLQDAIPEESRRPQGVHKRGGQQLRGPELEADAIEQLLKSVTPEQPRGMTNVELAALYDPPLSTRNAEKFGAAARRRIPLNGHAVV